MPKFSSFVGTGILGLFLVGCQSQNSELWFPDPVSVTRSSPDTLQQWPRSGKQLSGLLEEKKIPPHNGPKITFKIGTSFPAGFPLLGEGAEYFANQLPAGLNAKVSGAGYPIGPFAVFDATKNGIIDANWSHPQYWIGIDPGFAALSSLPFGADTVDLIRWRFSASGEMAADKLYGPHGLKGMLCGILPTKGEVWTKNEITAADFFNTARIRHPGIVSKLMEDMGADHIAVPSDQYRQAVPKGIVDALHLSTPAIDDLFNLQKTAKHYYYPSVLSVSSSVDLTFQLETWNSLSGDDQEAIKQACRNTVSWMLKTSSERDRIALNEFQEAGVSIHKLPPNTLKALEAATKSFLNEYRSSNNFRSVHNSLLLFQFENDGLIQMTPWE